MIKNKRVVIGCAIAIVLTLVAVAVYIIYRRNDSSHSEIAYVSKVTDIGGIIIGGGASNRYAGVVESLDTWKVNKDSSSTVKEIFVNVGDKVFVGTPLFTYDAEAFSAQLMQAQIDLERMNNERDSIGKTINQLEKDRKNASSSERSYITIQIQEQELAKKQSELDIQAQEQKIARIKENIQNATVSSEVEGVVKSISNDDDNNTNYNGDNSFITIIRDGEMRVKCQINEQNIGDIVEGDSVIIHSRVDKNMTWKGTISKIDYESTQNSGSMYGYGYGSMDGMTNSSSYSFYIDLETSEGLMIGQHVYVEKDMGLDDKNDGLWLEEYLIIKDNGSTFVWADNGRGRLEKRNIALGEYDEDLKLYRIVSGLKEDDLVAVPDPSYVAGMRTAPMDEMAFDGMDYGMNGAMVGDEGVIDFGEGMYENEGGPDRDVGMFDDMVIGGDDGVNIDADGDSDQIEDVQAGSDAEGNEPEEREAGLDADNNGAEAGR